MSFINNLFDNRNRLSEKWLTLMIETYPKESGKFLFQKKNQFTNPIGHAYEQGLAEAFTAIFSNKPEELQKALEEIVKIRSIQDYSASFAMNFMFILKDIVLEEYEHYGKSSNTCNELVEALRLCDEALKAAFDMFVAQRELLYEIKANEVKKRTYKMIDRLNRKYDSMEDN